MICLAATGSASAIDAEDRDVAGVGLQQPGDHPERRRLAGAVGAEQRVELAGADGKIEPVDGRAVEAFRQAAHVKRGRGMVLVHGRCGAVGLLPRPA